MTQNIGESSDWNAWHDHQPGAPATLFVTGRVTFPTGGYRVELKPLGGGVGQEGEDRRKLHLEKIVHPPEGGATQAFTTLDVRYEQQTDAEYAEVVIHPDNVTVPVEETH